MFTTETRYKAFPKIPKDTAQDYVALALATLAEVASDKGSTCSSRVEAARLLIELATPSLEKVKGDA